MKKTITCNIILSHLMLIQLVMMLKKEGYSNYKIILALSIINFIFLTVLLYQEQRDMKKELKNIGKITINISENDNITLEENSPNIPIPPSSPNIPIPMAASLNHIPIPPPPPMPDSSSSIINSTPLKNVESEIVITAPQPTVDSDEAVTSTQKNTSLTTAIPEALPMPTSVPDKASSPQPSGRLPLTDIELKNQRKKLKKIPADQIVTHQKITNPLAAMLSVINDQYREDEDLNREDDLSDHSEEWNKEESGPTRQPMTISETSPLVSHNMSSSNPAIINTAASSNNNSSQHFSKSSSAAISHTITTHTDLQDQEKTLKPTVNSTQKNTSLTTTITEAPSIPASLPDKASSPQPSEVPLTAIEIKKLTPPKPPVVNSDQQIDKITDPVTAAISHDITTPIRINIVKQRRKDIQPDSDSESDDHSRSL